MNTVRKTIEIDTELADTIQSLADSQLWSFSKMSYVLLQRATKEATRKRNARKNNTQHNTADVGSGNSK